MEVVKQTKDYTILKKRSGKYGVRSRNTWVNGDEKVKILLAEGLIEAPAPKAKEEDQEATENIEVKEETAEVEETAQE